MDSKKIYIEKIRKKEGHDTCSDRYPYNIPAIRTLYELEFRKPVTFLVGENGMGKSTLIEAIAVKAGFNPEGGSRNFRFATKATHSDLSDRLVLTRSYRRNKDGYFLRAESYYNVATEIDTLDEVKGAGTPVKDYYGGRSLHEQSHGESFMALLLNRFYGNGLYLLDEPEAALSPARQLVLLTRMNELVCQDSQFIIATHSPIIMAYPDADIYVISESGIQLTAYEETEHYRLTRYFLDNRERVLADLF